MSNEAVTPCTCGSGGHPRHCAKHPEEYAKHCAELDWLNAYDTGAEAMQNAAVEAVREYGRSLGAFGEIDLNEVVRRIEAVRLPDPTTPL